MGFEVDLRGLSKRYRTGEGTIVALDAVSLHVPGGQMVALAGPSGSGKSSLLHCIGAMDRPDGGQIRVEDQDLTSLSRSQQATYRRRIGFVFQRFHLLPALTVLHNVVAPLLPFRTDFDKFQRARELLAGVGLAERQNALPSRLSGGEQQRVAIARALINGPGLLLADEPTGNLDSQTGSEIMQLLLNFRGDREMTVLVATHDPVVASRCDRVVRLRDGRVVDDVPVSMPKFSGNLLDEIGRLNPDA